MDELAMCRVYEAENVPESIKKYFPDGFDEQVVWVAFVPKPHQPTQLSFLYSSSFSNGSLEEVKTLDGTICLGRNPL